MSSIVFIAIPINLCVLFYARNPGERAIGALQDMDTIEVEKQSAVIQYLFKRSDFWTRANIPILFIVVEHAMIFIQSFLSFLIPELPDNVIKAERTSKHLSKKAQKEFNSLKDD